MDKKCTFVSKSYYPCTARELYEWHSREGALERLIPPWENTSVISQHGGIAPGGRVEMKMHAGPFPFTWQAHHVEDVPGIMFRDIQHRGPFRYWSHSHLFSDTEKGALLEDRVEYALPAHTYLPKFLHKHLEKTLRRIFAHRQNKIHDDLLLHQRYSNTPMRILITGASGVLGKALLPLLTTGGHGVWTLVRRKPDPSKNEIFWDPAAGELDTDSLPELDAVIHLAGEYIGLGRWTKAKKERVVNSRTGGTLLLTQTLASMAKPPDVLLSASAVGYYGDCGDSQVKEDQKSGEDFISEVCRCWENATRPAIKAGIRTVCMRIGVVLTPQGGALQRFINSSRLGLMSRIGSGQQYMSWLTIDDMISAMLHSLTCPELEGPVNFAAPQPVTNIELMKTLGRVIRRPLMPPVPVSILKAIYGQMASEILLSGCQVSCQKLIDSGFRFRHPNLDEALRDLLGK